MKIAYFDCSSGISGDMILGALVDAGAPFDKLKEGLSQLSIDGYSITATPVLKKGVRATKVDVVVEGPDLPGRPLKDLREIISDSALDSEIKSKSISIFQRLAEAESVVHNCPVEDVHFHEVGHIDTIVDIVGSVYAFHLLGIDKVISSPVDTGSGSEKTNVLRVFIGEDTALYGTDEVCVIETNIDDMNPQVYEYLMDRLFEAGALDVYITPVVMKKSRPAQLLSVTAKVEYLNNVRELIFRETTTIGVRVSKMIRSVLTREIKEVQLPYGTVRVKISGSSNGVCNIVPEYEDCKTLAMKTGIPLRDIMELASRL